MSEPANGINAYHCQSCGWIAVTKNLVEGTTPFMIGCEAEGCDGVCFSSFYRVPQTLTPTHEWYRPSGDTVQKLHPDVQEHVLMGGLLLRRVNGTVVEF